MITKTIPYNPPCAISAERPDERGGFLLFILLLLGVLPFIGRSQSVTEIITDYNGYWKSSASAINAVKPDNTHNLVSFMYSGVRYSTGVNDPLLSLNGQLFVPGDYKALPVYKITGAVNSNTKIGLGASYDHVPNGASNPPPVNNLTKYLTDGLNGLDLGTCVANLPAGNLLFNVNNLRSQLVGDGVPDLLITQVADPSASSLDSYEFTDINGNRVGNSVSIVLNTLSVVGNWTADFYEASTNPMVLTGGFTRTDRPIRLWAADFSAFGINSGNIASVAYFKITLNGNSDVAFVAYNNAAVNLIAPLPVKLTYFNAYAKNTAVELSWQTTLEQHSDKFVIERSTNGTEYMAIDSVSAAGVSYTVHNYSYTDHQLKNGKAYYRLKQIDIDGQFEFSQVSTVTLDAVNNVSVRTYPNPVTSNVTIKHPTASGSENVQLLNAGGSVLLQKHINQGVTETKIDLRAYTAGVYFLVWNDGTKITSQRIVKQ